ncbi:MAG: Cys-tRNA(Pro) deacylase [Anaerolineales bacterium]|nr:Cys-tRNA(Pro) deacylase [Anaerolineales bacterium]
MPPTNNVTRMLASKGIAFEAHDLPPEKLGGEEAAAFLGVPAEQVFKTIVAVRASGGKPLLALVPAPAQLSLKALGRALDAKLQLATQAQAEKLTGLQTGGISPLALIGKGFDVALDQSALDFETIYLSGGQRGLNVSMSPQDLVALTRAKVMGIADR